MEIKKTEIVYVNGDATAPIGEGKKVIVHVCNNIGAWGAGFVLAISKKWKQPEAAYRTQREYILGDYHLVQVEDDIQICNLIGQDGIISRKSNGITNKTLIPPVRYVAIERALRNLATMINAMNTHPISIHMPMIGSGLAGGNWKIIERIIEVTLCDAGIPVTVYKFI